MNVGKRHRRAPQWAHLSLLMSVIALALACSPALAQAECTSSSCVQYTESIPKPEGENTPTHHQKTPAKASKTGNSGGSEPSQPGGSKGAKEAEGSEEGEASEKEGTAVPGHDGGNGQGKPGGSAHEGGNKAVNPGAQSKPGVQASSKSSDGGSSSPLVPVLIAIAVLAAISVAVVMIRQRRQRRGPTTTASPEAN
jgi:cobalamin biosynthesis Mg chelatase CobN